MAKKEALTGSEEVLTYIAEKVTEVLKQRGVDKGTIAAAALAVYGCAIGCWTAFIPTFQP